MTWSPQPWVEGEQAQAHASQSTDTPPQNIHPNDGQMPGGSGLNRQAQDTRSNVATVEVVEKEVEVIDSKNNRSDISYHQALQRWAVNFGKERVVFR